MNICDTDIFPENTTFYLTLKNGWSKHDFFVLLNAPVGVHETAKNLLTRIGIRDLEYLNEIFIDFFSKLIYFIAFKNSRLIKFIQSNVLIIYYF